MPRAGAALMCCLLAAAAGGGVSTPPTRVVHTRLGRLQGTLLAASERLPRAVERYLAVPYATPPLGAARFGPTRAPAPWEGVRRDAGVAGPACPQRLPEVVDGDAALERMPLARLQQLRRIVPFVSRQSEDCLYLNVFAPAQGAEWEVFPVLVLIHGEDFSSGSAATLDGSVLASLGGLVVVTLDYRLGPLGFLNANPAPRRKARVANYGLMDQIAALHWVQQNVAQFGGDPANVTLMGHGAAAACIHFLMASPAVVPGLFHRAVLLSGSALASWALVHQPSVHAVSLAGQLNCTVPHDLELQHEDIVDCLRDVPVDRLLQTRVEAPMYLHAWGPSIDGVVVLPAEDRQPRQGQYAVLLGVSTAEAAHLFPEHDLRSGFESERRDELLRAYVRAAYSHHLAEIFYTVSNEYTEWDRTALHPANTRDATLAAIGDARYVAPVLAAADEFASGGGGPVFFGVFDHHHHYQAGDGDHQPQWPGAVYGEVLAFTLGAPLADGALGHFSSNYSRPEAGLSEAFIAYLAAFAATGDPNSGHLQDSTLHVSKERNRFRGLVWEPYDTVHQKYLEISMKPRMRNHYRAHQLSVWLRLVPELQRAGMASAPRHSLLRDPEHPSERPANDSSPDTGAEQAQPTCMPAALGAASLPPPGDLPLPGLDHATALSLTVAVGCSLLVLNVLIFAGVCYRRDSRGRRPTAAGEKRLGDPRAGVVFVDVEQNGGGSPTSRSPVRQGVMTILLETPFVPAGPGAVHGDRSEPQKPDSNNSVSLHLSVPRLCGTQT